MQLTFKSTYLVSESTCLRHESINLTHESIYHRICFTNHVNSRRHKYFAKSKKKYICISTNYHILQSEEHIKNLLKEGSPKAFEYIFTKYHKSLCAYVYKIIPDIDEAKEIVQQCFVTLWV